MFTDKVRVLSDSCGGGALHKSKIYLTGVGTRNDSALNVPVIKKKKIKSSMAQESDKNTHSRLHMLSKSYHILSETNTKRINPKFAYTVLVQKTKIKTNLLPMHSDDHYTLMKGCMHVLFDRSVAKQH
jgi:hypothetical protein